MTSFKNLAILILGFALFQATLASTYCNVQLFKNSLNDGDQDKLYQYHRSSDSQETNNAPFDGQNAKFYTTDDIEPRTISSFRALIVDMEECGPCTIVAYSGKDRSGKKSEHIVEWGSADGQVNFEFCVKSFTLDCVGNHTEAEEEEEEEEEEEQYEEDQ